MFPSPRLPSHNLNRIGGRIRAGLSKRNHSGPKIEAIKEVVEGDKEGQALPDSHPQYPGAAQPHLPVGGRLQYFWKVWKGYGAHPYIVSILRSGFKIPFQRKPPVTQVPKINSTYSDPTKRRLLQEAIQSLLTKRAIEFVKNPRSPGFYSRMFLVPKKTGDWRPVTDLSALNQFIQCPTFKMDTAEHVRTSLQVGQWLTSIDLKDAYLHVPIHPGYRKFLRIQVLGRVYQFRVLPFGINVAPRLFTKIAAQVKVIMVRESIKIHQYIDDWLVKAGSEEQVSHDTQRLLRISRELR